MSSRLVVGLLGGAACWLFAASSHAQCTKDTDCKAERVCEQGACVPPPVSSSAATPADARLSAAPANPTEPRRVTAPNTEAGYEDEASERRPRRAKRNWKRHSSGMMAGGIVMVSVAPVALLVSLVTSLKQDSCEAGGTYNFASAPVSDGHCERYDAAIYGGVILGVGLLGAGIPLIVIGGKREPLGTASIAPWARPGGGGLELRLSL